MSGHTGARLYISTFECGPQAQCPVAQTSASAPHALHKGLGKRVQGLETKRSQVPGTLNPAEWPRRVPLPCGHRNPEHEGAKARPLERARLQLQPSSPPRPVLSPRSSLYPGPGQSGSALSQPFSGHSTTSPKQSLNPVLRFWPRLARSDLPWRVPQDATQAGQCPRLCGQRSLFPHPETLMGPQSRFPWLRLCGVHPDSTQRAAGQPVWEPHPGALRTPHTSFLRVIQAEAAPPRALKQTGLAGSRMGPEHWKKSCPGAGSYLRTGTLLLLHAGNRTKSGEP